jgi:hypothetical protein
MRFPAPVVSAEILARLKGIAVGFENGVPARTTYSLDPHRRNGRIVWEIHQNTIKRIRIDLNAGAGRRNVAPLLIGRYR